MNNTPKITTFFTAIRSTESTCSSETPSETAETLNLKRSIDEDGEQSLNKKLNSQVCYCLKSEFIIILII